MQSRAPCGLQAGPLQRGLRQQHVLGSVKRSAAAVAALPRPQQTTAPDAASSSSSGRAPGAGAAAKIAQRAAAALCAAAVVLAPLPGAPTGLVSPAVAADVAKVGTCLLSKCQVALARCLADGQCVQNLVCLNLCNGAEDETACQIKCGDQYGDAAIDAFNSCAVSEEKCVPQRIDENLFPVPPDTALDAAFDLASFTGRWYITAGLNPLFDIFDCQEHFFVNPDPGSLTAQINWRISKPRGDWMQRSTIQTFVQDGERPAVLYNHGNEYLHYEDDWYVIGSKPESYVFVYYKGNNDAWKGYGGAVVYTRDNKLPQDLVPELTEAAAKVGLKWGDFTVTDNTCGPHPPKTSLIQEVEEDVVAVEEAAAMKLRSFGRGFTVLEDRLTGELVEEERALTRDLRDFERLLEKVEKRAADKIQEEEDFLGSLVARLTKAFQR